MDVSCAQCREQLGEILESERRASRGLSTPSFRGELPEDDAIDLTTLQAHLQNCPACQRELAQMRAMQNELFALPALAAPDDLRARIRAQLEQEIHTAPIAVVTSQNTPLQVLAEGPKPSATKAQAKTNWRERMASWWRPNQLAWAGGGLALAAFCVLVVSQNPPDSSTLVMSESAPAPSESAASPQQNTSPPTASQSKTQNQSGQTQRDSATTPNRAARTQNPSRPSPPPALDIPSPSVAPRDSRPATGLSSQSAPPVEPRVAAPAPQPVTPREKVAPRTQPAPKAPAVAPPVASSGASQSPSASAKRFAIVSPTPGNAATISIRVGPVSAPATASALSMAPAPTSSPEPMRGGITALEARPNVESRTILREDAGDSESATDNARGAASGGFGGSASETAPAPGGFRARTAPRALPTPSAASARSNARAMNRERATFAAPESAPNAPVSSAPTTVAPPPNSITGAQRPLSTDSSTVADATAGATANKSAPEALAPDDSNRSSGGRGAALKAATTVAARAITVEIVPTRDITRAVVRAQIGATWRIVSPVKSGEIWRGATVAKRPVRLHLQVAPNTPQNPKRDAFKAPATLSVELFDESNQRVVARQKIVLPSAQP